MKLDVILVGSGHAMDGRDGKPGRHSIALINGSKTRHNDFCWQRSGQRNYISLENCFNGPGRAPPRPRHSAGPLSHSIKCAHVVHILNPKLTIQQNIRLARCNENKKTVRELLTVSHIRCLFWFYATNAPRKNGSERFLRWLHKTFNLCSVPSIATGWRPIYDLRQLLRAQRSRSKINSHSESLWILRRIFPFRFRLIVLIIIIPVDYCVVVNERGRVQMVGLIFCTAIKLDALFIDVVCRCFVLSQEMNYGHFSGSIWLDSERSQTLNAIHPNGGIKTLFVQDH